MFIHNTDLYLLPQHRDAYIKAIVAEVRTAKRHEPGIKAFDVMQNMGDPNLIHTVEIYTDKPTWEAHHRQPYLLEFIEKTKGWSDASRRRISVCRNLEPLDDGEFERAPRGRTSAPDPSKPLYLHNTWMFVQPQHRAAFAEALVNEVRAAKRMERCILRFEVYQNIDDPNLFHTYEIYTDKQAALFHDEQKYMHELHAIIIPMLDRTPRPGGRKVDCVNLEPTSPELWTTY